MITLEAELAGEERAIRHLIGELAALDSQTRRAEARARLHAPRAHATTTRHPAVQLPAPGFPHGDRFPDVSNHQPHVDLDVVRRAGTVRAGQLVVTKLTEGIGFTDAYAARWRRMRELGFPHRGGYAFLHPSQSGVAQAEHLLGVLGGDVTPADVIIADLEVSDGQPAGRVQACAREFAETIAAHTPAKRWLYGGAPFLGEFGVPLDGYHAHWLAAYVADPAPFLRYGRARTVAWQYTDGLVGPFPHVCPGIGPVDMSIIL